jgi:CheY-like chemotaxis protein
VPQRDETEEGERRSADVPEDVVERVGAHVLPCPAQTVVSVVLESTSSTTLPQRPFHTASRRPPGGLAASFLRSAGRVPGPGNDPVAGGGEQLESRAPVVLVVDDEPAIRLVCRLNLQTAGFETIEASDGETALELARSEHPDLILLDIMLPKSDGFTVARELVAAAETREIPIVFITARSDAKDQLRGYEAGGIAFVTKPFDPDLLPETVRTTIERVRRGEREALRREWRETL